MHSKSKLDVNGAFGPITWYGINWPNLHSDKLKPTTG